MRSLVDHLSLADDMDTRHRRFAVASHAETMLDLFISTTPRRPTSCSTPTPGHVSWQEGDRIPCCYDYCAGHGPRVDLRPPESELPAKMACEDVAHHHSNLIDIGLGDLSRQQECVGHDSTFAQRHGHACRVPGRDGARMRHLHGPLSLSYQGPMYIE